MSLNEQAQMLVRKAAADEAALNRLIDADEVDDEVVGFHAQQAVEKLLKAWLSQLGVNYPKTHNLQTLLELLERRGKALPQELAEIDRFPLRGATSGQAFGPGPRAAVGLCHPEVRRGTTVAAMSGNGIKPSMDWRTAGLGATGSRRRASWR